MIKLETIVAFCKRKGFIFPASEPYGGISSLFDYGPLGIELKNNLSRLWWKEMVWKRGNIVGLDSAILMPEAVWKASGHIDGFADSQIECLNCHGRFREDFVKNQTCPICKTQAQFSEPKQFNLMFSTHLGSVQDKGSLIFLRPETAQGIYLNFKNVLDSQRQRVPFGIAQIGKAFRNEMTTKSFIFRTCEFEQMEMQFFVHPKESLKYFDYWKQQRWDFYLDKLRISKENLREHPHRGDELAHYADRACDIEYRFPMGFQELEGIHLRADYDLKQHSQFSQKPGDFFYHDPVTQEKYIPHVVETSAGLTRMLLMVLCEAYQEQVLEDGQKRVVLGLPPLLAPIKVAVLPLMKKPPLNTLAKEIYKKLQNQGIYAEYDDSGNIGKRYRRQDEVGTPFCLTVDYDSLEQQSVTVRFRDTMEQTRLKVQDLNSFLLENLS